VSKVALIGSRSSEDLTVPPLPLIFWLVVLNLFVTRRVCQGSCGKGDGAGHEYVMGWGRVLVCSSLSRFECDQPIVEIASNVVHLSVGARFVQCGESPKGV